jgi:hypothetical protein
VCWQKQKNDGPTHFRTPAPPRSASRTASTPGIRIILDARTPQHFFKQKFCVVGIAAWGHSAVKATGRCMVAHCSNIQDLSRRTIPRHLTGHRTIIISSPLLLLLDILHQTRHNTALPIPMLSLPHTRASIKAGCRDAYRTLHYRHILAMTPLFLDSPCWDRHYPYRRPCYRIYALILQHRTCSLTTPGHRTQYRPHCYGYIGTLLYLHSSTSASEV